MKLYSVSDGPPTLAVRMLLKAINKEYEHVNVDYFKKEHMTEEYAKMNPQKEIPVLEDDGFFLGESVAIMQYLMDKYAPESPLYPKDPKERAIVNHRLCFNLSFFYPNVFAYAMNPIFFDYERTPYTLKRLNICLKTFETYMTQTKTKYVAADHLTIADFPLVTALMCLEAIKFGLDEYPLVKTWYETFKKENPELWKITEGGLQVLHYYIQNPQLFTNFHHPLHPVKKLK